MVIKWSDSVNIREPWRKGHSIFAAPSRGAGGRVGGGRAAGSRSGTSGSALHAVVGHQRSAEGYAGTLRRLLTMRTPGQRRSGRNGRLQDASQPP